MTVTFALSNSNFFISFIKLFVLLTSNIIANFIVTKSRTLNSFPNFCHSRWQIKNGLTFSLYVCSNILLSFSSNSSSFVINSSWFKSSIKSINKSGSSLYSLHFSAIDITFLFKSLLKDA